MSDYVSSYDRDAPVPSVGSRWVWEIDSPRARELIEVTHVKWNGEEWWVETLRLNTRSLTDVTDMRPPTVHWNDLSRFWEAVVPVGSKEDKSPEGEAH